MRRSPADGMPPSVSVITPLYNGAPHIAEAIASVQSQTFRDYEHIVVDNGSSDAGPDIVADLARTDPALRLLSQTARKGPGAARNAGMEAARGRYIAFLDADDMYTPDKLTRQIGTMAETRAAFSWAAYTRIDSHGTRLGVQGVPTRLTPDGFLHKRGIIGCLTAVYDCRLLGHHRMPNIPLRQDFCFFHALLAACARAGHPAIGIDAPLGLYRVHAGGISANKLRAAQAQWTAYRDVIGLDRGAALAAMASYTRHTLAARLGERSGARSGQ